MDDNAEHDEVGNVEGRDSENLSALVLDIVVGRNFMC